MGWEIEITEEFEQWWNSLDEDTTISIDAVVDLLMEHGPMLPRPHSDTIKGSKFNNMKELRIQHKGPLIASFMLLIPDVQLFY